MNISKNKILSLFIIILSIFLFTGCKKSYEYDEQYKIKIEDIFNQAEDSYLVYFYTNDCGYCASCYKSVNKYLKEYNSELMNKLYVCNLSDEGNELIRRAYDKEGGQGSKGTYYVDGVTKYDDLYISGVPSLIKITPSGSSRYLISGRKLVKDYFDNIFK